MADSDRSAVYLSAVGYTVHRNVDLMDDGILRILTHPSHTERIVLKMEFKEGLRNYSGDQISYEENLTLFEERLTSEARKNNIKI